MDSKELLIRIIKSISTIHFDNTKDDYISIFSNNIRVFIDFTEDGRKSSIKQGFKLLNPDILRLSNLMYYYADLNDPDVVSNLTKIVRWVNAKRVT